MRRALPAVLLLTMPALLAACGASLTRERRYSGELLPESECGAPLHGTLTAAGDKFAFAPSDGVLLLRGDVAKDGAASGTLTTTTP
ncbi:MAG: hypothetical protein JO326_04375, partial [Acetobacteraceae bacterium]|nr:hypothetical protein [Acetobacteraceae bacterium]